MRTALLGSAFTDTDERRRLIVGWECDEEGGR